MSDSQTTFEVFYREHKDSVFRAMVVWTGDATVAEDLVAEAFTRAAQRWKSLASHPAPAAWVVTTARNIAADESRRARRWGQFVGRFQAPRAVEASSNELDQSLLAAIARLPERQREAIAYRILLDLDTKTVAALLAVEPATVVTHLRRGLATLRNNLQCNDHPEQSIGTNNALRNS